MFAITLLSATLGAALPSDAPKVHETEVQRLHRKGVFCMDEIERPDCAIENFEAVLREETTERELVSDALLRLVKLQRKAGDDEAVRSLLRRFWDVGMKRRSGGHVPYSLRFFPPELDVAFNVDVSRIANAPIVTKAGDDLAKFVFTCDPEERNNIRMTRRWRRAEKRAAAQGKQPHEIIYAEMDADRKRRASWENDRRRNRNPPSRGGEPIFSSMTCKVAKALGDGDIQAWKKIAGAMSHEDFTRSMAAVQIPDLDAKLAAAVQAGRIRAHGRDRFVLAKAEYADQAVHLAKLDRDELVIARADMIEPVIAARSKRARRMNRDLDRLIGEVPRDSGFFLVLDQTAVESFGLGNLKKSTAEFLKTLLPRPKGLQIAVVLHDDVGMFTRMPTDNPVKGRMLVNIAQMMIDGRSEKDPQAEAWLRNLDVAEASDRKALLMTYVRSQAQIEEIIWD